MKTLPYSIRSDYLHDVFNPRIFRDVIENSAHHITDWEMQGNHFDAIAFRGISGAALAFPLSVKLKKSLLCIRKRDSSHHSQYVVEGNVNVGSYIIIDDFIDTGATISDIMTDIVDYLDSKPDCVGMYLYNQPNGHWRGLWAEMTIPHKKKYGDL